MEVIDKLLQTFWLDLQNGQLSHLGIWVYVLLAVVVAVEGPIATLLGAAVASAGYLRVNSVFISAFVGNLTADLSWYLLGYLGKIEWVMRFGKRFGLTSQFMERTQQELETNAPKLLIIAKLTAAFTIPMLIASGLARLPLKRWLPGYTLAEVVWTGCLVLIGFYATEAISRFEYGLRGLSIAAGVLFVIAGILFVRRTLRSRISGGVLRQETAAKPGTTPDRSDRHS
jgi:membrane protein DedA with SNARE-associated domain